MMSFALKYPIDLFGKMNFLSEDDRKKIEGGNLMRLLEEVGETEGRCKM